MEREDAKKAVHRLAASYPSWKIDSSIAAVWVEEFEQVSAEQVWANIQDWVRRGERFAPSLAEMIQLNPRLEAEKEKLQTQREIAEKDERIKNAVPPPWVREGLSKEEWQKGIIENPPWKREGISKEEWTERIIKQEMKDG